MQVRDAMTPGVAIVNPEDSIADAALAMAEIDVGALPVGENDRLVGMITDRDIAISHVPEIAGESLAGVSEPGGRHTQ